MAIYKIKRGLSASLQGATFEAYEPAYTTDTNELYVADANGQAVKVSDHIVVEALPTVEASVKGKFYVLVGEDSGTVNYFDGSKFIPLSQESQEVDLSAVQSALQTVSASLVGVENDIDTLQSDVEDLRDAVATKAEDVHAHAISDINDLQATLDNKLEAVDLTAIQNLAQKANDDLATHEANADTKYATKAEIADLADKTYVDGKITDLIDAAPEALDTLGEIATQLQSDSNAAQVVKTLAEANRDAIATKAGQTDLDAAEARIDALESKPELAETSIVAEGKEVKGAVNFVVTGGATLAVDEDTNTVSIDVPSLLEIDGGTF